MFTSSEELYQACLNSYSHEVADLLIKNLGLTSKLSNEQLYGIGEHWHIHDMVKPLIQNVELANALKNDEQLFQLILGTCKYSAYPYELIELLNNPNLTNRLNNVHIYKLCLYSRKVAEILLGNADITNKLSAEQLNRLIIKIATTYEDSELLALNLLQNTIIVNKLSRDQLYQIALKSERTAVTLLKNFDGYNKLSAEQLCDVAFISGSVAADLFQHPDVINKFSEIQLYKLARKNKETAKVILSSSDLIHKINKFNPQMLVEIINKFGSESFPDLSLVLEILSGDLLYQIAKIFINCNKLILSCDLSDRLNDEQKNSLCQLIEESEKGKYQPYTGSLFYQSLIKKEFKLSENFIKFCSPNYLRQSAGIYPQTTTPLQYLHDQAKKNGKEKECYRRLNNLLKERLTPTSGKEMTPSSNTSYQLR